MRSLEISVGDFTNILPLLRKRKGIKKKNQGVEGYESVKETFALIRSSSRLSIKLIAWNLRSGSARVIRNPNDLNVSAKNKVLAKEHRTYVEKRKKEDVVKENMDVERNCRRAGDDGTALIELDSMFGSSNLGLISSSKGWVDGGVTSTRTGGSYITGYLLMVISGVKGVGECKYGQRRRSGFACG
ncbi:hypothetical protein QOT17_024564 [Balamuthia mandrillaris]